MGKQFTASEVRELADRGTSAMQQFINGSHTLHIPPQPDDADMVIAECLRAVDAYADLLEAQEKAVPVMVVNHVSSAEHDLPIGMKLYTHSAQTQPPAASATPNLASYWCIVAEAAEVLQMVLDSGVKLPPNWRWPLLDELSGLSAMMLTAQEKPND